MIGTEFLKGQGLGNQLFCYVSARCIALAKGYEFGTAGQEQLAVNIHSKSGMYFMNLYLGQKITDTDSYKKYMEREDRIFLPNSKHDLKNGCYVSGMDSEIFLIQDGTLIYGNLQAEEYFYSYKEQIRDWLRVLPEYDTYEYSKDNLCIINIRGGEYTGSHELFLERKYWLNGIRYMQNIRADMKFMVITDDIEAARKILPEVEAYHFSLDKDYTIIKNARHILLSNSTFAFFPAFTSETVQTIIAPKYWARYNVSDGYWASEQNIYDGFCYMDKKGNIFTAEECREELERYKQNSSKYRKRNEKPKGLQLGFYKLRSELLKNKYVIKKLFRGVLRRIRGILQ